MELALARVTMPLYTSAEAFGRRMHQPLETFRNVLHTAAHIESTTPRPKSLVDPLLSLLDTLDETADALTPTDVLYHHISLLSIVASSLACVSVQDDLPADVVSVAMDEAQEHLKALRAMSHSSNQQLADAAENVLKKVMNYVTEHLREPLRFVEDSGSSSVVGNDNQGGVGKGKLSEHSAPHLVAYRTNVIPVVDEFEEASSVIGGDVAAQAGKFCAAVRLVYDFVVKASEMKSAPGEEEQQQMLTPIIAEMSAVAEIAAKIGSTHELFNHFKAVEDAVGMVSWIVAESKPTGFVSDAEAAADFYLNKTLVATKKGENAAKHKMFVEALRKVLAANKAYIKEYHTMGLRYGAGVEAKSGMDSTAPTITIAEETEEGDTYVTAFQALIDGPLAAYVEASKVIAAEVAQQAEAFAASWKAEKEFLAKAYNMSPPEDAQPMLAPIAGKMAAVNAIAERVDPRGPISQHCNAVSESVAALGWVAVDERAAVYVADMAAAGQFFLDKVKMGAKNTSNPEAHRTWARCLEMLFADLNAYVKEYHTQKLVWNPPKVNRVTKSAGVPHDDGEDSGTTDYASAFKALIDSPLAVYVKASKAIGGEVAEQAAAFAAAWNEEAEFLAKAINMPKPEDYQDLLTPIANKMSEVSAVADKVDPRGPLMQHCNAVGESVAALGWVAVDEKATAYVGDMAGAGQFFLDKVKMGAKKTDNPDAHRAWVASVETLLAELKTYVKEYHTQKLTWNPPKVKKVLKKASAGYDDDDKSDVDYATAFKALIDGPLATYLKAADAIGGEVATQAASFREAWVAEAEFLDKAINMPKPTDFQDMLAPIASRMGEVGAVLERIDPRGPIVHHCNAVGESVAALGWIAVDGKTTTFVADMAGAGQFFIDKVKMNAKKTNNPDIHRAWASALETLFANLKAYVREYHTHSLVWNPPKATKIKASAISQKGEESRSGRLDSITAFKNLISGPLAAFVQLSKEIGDEVAHQADAFAGAWEAEAEFLAKASKMSKPEDFQEMLAPIAAKMGEVSSIAEKVGFRGALSQHCNAVGESIGALGWVAVDEKATSYVGEIAGAGQFYVDRVKMRARETNKSEVHRAWANALENLFVELKAYVKEYHTQRLMWNTS